jgi:ribosomal protein S21
VARVFPLPPASRTSMPAADSVSQRAAQTAAQRGERSASVARIRRAVATRAVPLVRLGRCTRPCARAAATLPACRSSRARTSRCIARHASSSGAARTPAVAATPAAGATDSRHGVASCVLRLATRKNEVPSLPMHVEAREGEPFDQLLRRFKTGIDKAGILREYKRKQRFKSAGELRREKAKAAARRRTKRPRARAETRR